MNEVAYSRGPEDRYGTQLSAERPVVNLVEGHSRIEERTTGRHV